MPTTLYLGGTFFFVYYMSVRRPKFCMSVGFSLPCQEVEHLLGSRVLLFVEGKER